ncbi:MAG: hypothetical protein ACT4P0_08385 [Panacagrimonas sp.]
MHHGLKVCALLAAGLLAACESSLNVDVAVNALPTQQSQSTLTATLRIAGLSLETTSGTTRKLTRNDVLELISPGINRVPATQDLISNARIADGEYQGLRLDFASTVGSVASSQSTVKQTIVNGAATVPFSDVAFMFKDDDDDKVSLLVALDLPLSLSRDDDGSGYVLNPVVRAMERSDAGTIQGTIPASRLPNTVACESGASVYAFLGADVTPDERDGQDAEPVATTFVPNAGLGATYTLPFLAPGTYTLALTCDGERENGLEKADPAMTFSRGPRNLKLDAGETLQANFAP